MLRFDSESELQSHELGRSLLCMIRDDDMGFVAMPRADALLEPTNPFDAVRERLAAADLALRDLHAQVFPNHLLLHLFCIYIHMEVCIEFHAVNSSLACTHQHHWRFAPYTNFTIINSGRVV